MKKTYTIIFKAELTEDDLKAMQGCFYQAMNESMEISEVWGLKIKEDKEDDFLEPNNGFYHIHDCVDALMACETIEEVYALFGAFPNKFGEWWVDVVGEGEDAYYEVTNEWWDEQYEELNSRTFDLEIEVEEEDED
jgi:hypothetical protein